MDMARCSWVPHGIWDPMRWPLANPWHQAGEPLDLAVAIAATTRADTFLKHFETISGPHTFLIIFTSFLAFVNLLVFNLSISWHPCFRLRRFLYKLFKMIIACHRMLSPRIIPLGDAACSGADQQQFWQPGTKRQNMRGRTKTNNSDSDICVSFCCDRTQPAACVELQRFVLCSTCCLIASKHDSSRPCHPTHAQYFKTWSIFYPL